MGDLRKPFLLLAMLAIVLAIGVELGAGLLLGGADAGAALADSAGALDVELDDVSGVSEPSGRGTGYLALIDAVAVWSTGLFCLALLLPERVQGRVQGVAGLIFSIILIIVGLVALVIAFVELTIMVSLFLAAPFGTLAYLALWGFFPVGEAAVLLGLVLLLKLVWAGLLVLAQPRFLQNKGLVLLILTTLLCTVVLEFLHNLVPVILVSIVDDVAALVFAIIAIIWGLVLLIGSIPAIVKAIRVTAALPARASATTIPRPVDHEIVALTRRAEWQQLHGQRAVLARAAAWARLRVPSATTTACRPRRSVPAATVTGSSNANATPTPGYMAVRVNHRSPSPRPVKTRVYAPPSGPVPHSATQGSAEPLTASSPVAVALNTDAGAAETARQKNPPYPAPPGRPLVAGLPSRTSCRAGALSV